MDSFVMSFFPRIIVRLDKKLSNERTHQNAI